MADDGKTTEQLKRIIQLLQAIDASTMATQANTAAISEILVQTNSKLDAIIKLLTPAPDTDITNLGGSISPPVKQTT